MSEYKNFPADGGPFHWKAERVEPAEQPMVADPPKDPPKKKAIGAGVVVAATVAGAIGGVVTLDNAAPPPEPEPVVIEVVRVSPIPGCDWKLWALSLCGKMK
jgi:hypothetical protein